MACAKLAFAKSARDADLLHEPSGKNSQVGVGKSFAVAFKESHERRTVPDFEKAIAIGVRYILDRLSI
jgi:hypothetical protein